MRILLLCITICACLAVSCKSPDTLFQLISPAQSGIQFENRIIENDTINPFDVTNMYNGAGVGVADFNNDGLNDVYFAGNQVACRLYLNKDNFKFSDVTAKANVDGNGRWCRGVSIVDINNDGWQDIYVCATIYSYAAQRKNLLYINKGNNADGIPIFKESAAEYGLDDDSHSAMAAFFDYDNDGDLDVYITVNETVEGVNPSVYRKKITDGSWQSTGRLYKNDWNDSLGHALFTNASKQAGITIEGYSHSATIADFNRDGWKDIFVANDFLSNDVLYINNHNGTFTDKSAVYFKHTSANGMGSDVIDINNDGLADLIEMDMDPADNYRKKVLMSGYNYLNYQNNILYGYQYQYVRNTFQLNQGPRPGNGDTINDPIFGDIGFYAGISSTDWSWAPVVQDFDDDGLRDIIVTNGFPKDLTDHDFLAFREKAFANRTKREVLDAIPIVRIKNFAFKNNGHTRFDNVTNDWGLKELSFSNGAAYADLDNDGDLDLVINNINDKAFVYKNNANEKRKDSANYLTVILKGDSLNKQGIGTWVQLHYGNQQQVMEYTPYRGFLSSMPAQLHFGLGTVSTVDSVIVIWPNNHTQTIKAVKAGQPLQLEPQNAHLVFDWHKAQVKPNALFEDVTGNAGMHYLHKETDFIDFNIQKLIPHKLSESTPALAAADMNNDGLEDIVVGGSSGNAPVLFIQNSAGSFVSKPLFPSNIKTNWEAVSIALFDADGDHDTDIYIACGSNEAAAGSDAYQDKLMLNDGKGNFTLAKAALPENHTSKACVKAMDYDKDGDLDLFIAGRCYPWNYPKPVSSCLLRNDSKNGIVKFTDVTAANAAMLNNIGMICDAVCTDYNNDGWPDLLLAGEWMSLKILKNDHGTFKDVTATSGINDQSGWWNSIVSGDFDNDGDEDYIAGNLGENAFYKASKEYPVSIYSNDFYKQGTTQCLVTLYLKDSADGKLKEFTAQNRDDVIEQLPFIKKRFLTYASFAKASFNQLFTPQELKTFAHYSANNFTSSYVRNDGNGKFTLQPLPPVAQFSVLSAMVTGDFNNDGNLDVCINTNDYGTDPANGRYDALNGLVLKGNGKGSFTPMPAAESGIFIPGNGKGMVKLKSANGHLLIVAGQNKDSLKVFQLK